MPHPGDKHSVRCFSRTVRPPGNVAGLRRWVASRRGGVMLESVARDDRWGRYSIFAVEPSRVIQIHEGDSADPFAALAEVCRPWTLYAEADIPFYGGWIGYLAYEAGRFLEPCNEPRASRENPLPDGRGSDGNRTGLPLAWWGFYDTVLVVDHLRDEWRVAGLVTPDADEVELRVRLWEDGIAESDHCGALIEGHGIRDGSWNDTPDHYRANTRRVIDYIRAGDVFQVNLARRYRARCDVSAVHLYQRLCDANPACYSAFLQGGPGHEWAVLSSSPELFLSVDDGVVLTRPIKGTAPRVGSRRGCGEPPNTCVQPQGSRRTQYDYRLAAE
jgi:para-aminobenzoate synthetase component I